MLYALNKQKMHHDYHERDRTFDIDDPVLCQNYGRGDELLLGHIIVKSGPVSFQIKLNDGHIMKRHQEIKYVVDTVLKNRLTNYLKLQYPLLFQ